MFSVIKLASKTLPEQYSPSLFNYFYETFTEGFIVAEKNHKIIGFIIGVTTTPNIAKILMLAVEEPVRKQKIGTELLNKFLEQISLKNIKHIELEVRTDNKKAITFYEKLGFIINEKIPEFYQNQEDAYNMIKII